MSNVRFDLDACEELLLAQQRLSDELNESIRALSPLVSDAHRLLDLVPHPNFTPTAGIHNAAIGVSDDRRDLEWRVEFIQRMDGHGLVEASNLPDWTWEQAQAWYLAVDIEALVEERDESTSLAEAHRLQDRLEDMVAEYIGTDDPAAVAAVIAGLNNGESLFNAVRGAGVRMQEAAYVETINHVADARDLSFDEAEELWAELQPQIAALVEQGFSPGEATDAVFAADELDLDIEAVVELADDEGIGIFDALAAHARASHYDMSIAEVAAYDGLNAHFDAFDNAKGGDTDGKVSLEDLQYVVDNASRFSADEVAAAAALLASPGLLSRLDTGRDNNDVLNDGDRFGDSDFDDRKISLDDLESFEFKQGVNAFVGTHFDEIDIINGGEHDQHLSKADFEAYLELHEDDLSDDEVWALQTVIEGELYDKGWLERNKRSIAIAAAVVAGTVIAGASFGSLTGVSLVLVTAAATAGGGAAAAGGTTLLINGISDESDWDDDLYSNAGHGALAGMAGGGLRVGAQHWIASPGTLSRTATGLGITSDVAGITALGGFDPLLEQIPGADLDDIHDVADDISLATGVWGIGTAGIDASVRWYSTNMAEGIARQSPHLVESASTFRTRGISETDARTFLDSPEGLPAMQQRFGENLESFSHEGMDYLIRDIRSGSSTPTLVVENPDVLVKVIRQETGSVNAYSPFFTTQAELDRLSDQGRSLADAFSLPYVSTADNYSFVTLAVPENATLYQSTVAPSSELYGTVRHNGGATQILVLDRGAFPAPVITDQVIPNGGLAPHVPIREAVTSVEGAINPPSTSNQQGIGEPVLVGH